MFFHCFSLYRAFTLQEIDNQNTTNFTFNFILKKMYTIRLAQEKDALGILTIYRPFVETTTVSFELEVPTLNDIKNRIKQIIPRYPYLVCLHNESVVGYAYAGLHRKREAYQWSTEVSVYIHEDYRKKRIGTALYKALLAILKLQGFKNIIAGITIPNPKSIAFHQSFGFHFFARYENVGFKFNNWHSTEWYQISFLEGKEKPKNLVSVLDIAKMEDWKTIIHDPISIIRP